MSGGWSRIHQRWIVKISNVKSYDYEDDRGRDVNKLVVIVKQF